MHVRLAGLGALGLDRQLAVSHAYLDVVGGVDAGKLGTELVDPFLHLVLQPQKVAVEERAQTCERRKVGERREAVEEVRTARAARDATDVERQAYSQFLQGFSRCGDGAADLFTMRDAIKIAGSDVVRAGELQANTRPRSGSVRLFCVGRLCSVTCPYVPRHRIMTFDGRQ